MYTYDRVAHGFAARLTPSQASQLQNIPGVISVLPDQIHHLQTTRSPQFLGLTASSGLWPSSDYGADVIVGVVDTGIWPESRSFSGTGLSPKPTSWNNKCDVAPDFPATSCNNKIIGARFFYAGFEAAYGPVEKYGESKSPRDMNGHGTHCASTAAGSPVANAEVLGYAPGEARGVASKAKVAVYKALWNPGVGADSDILAAIEKAVEDGVHVLSLSLGVKTDDGFARAYHLDPVAVGAFGAMNQGVVVSCAAGNDGPTARSAKNIAPWMITVGASTIDREFPVNVILGDGRTFTGTTLYSGTPATNLVSMVYGGNAGSVNCLPGKLVAGLVSGKIVFCEQVDTDDISTAAKGVAVAQAGGYGIIVANKASNGFQLDASADLIPTALVTATDGDQIRNYVSSTPFASARFVLRGTVTGTSPSAPRVAAFSGRGPNFVTPEILKPDVIAPGVNILAAWTGARGPSQTDVDTRRTEFNVLSGTSMACPHVSGLAAMLLKVNPNWSLAAIRSALMTTAYNKDNLGNNLIDLSNGKQSLAYYHGSGHVDQVKAQDPGLVYDLGVNDYVDFLCTIGYNSQTIQIFTKVPVDCSNRNLGNPGSLNYPSFSVVFTSNPQTITYKRTVKNVGSKKNIVYTARGDITGPDVNVNVNPQRLVFSDTIDVLSYEVTFTNAAASGASFGYLIWEDGEHVVRSPIAVIRKIGPLVSEL